MSTRGSTAGAPPPLSPHPPSGPAQAPPASVRKVAISPRDPNESVIKKPILPVPASEHPPPSKSSSITPRSKALKEQPTAAPSKPGDKPSGLALALPHVDGGKDGGAEEAPETGTRLHAPGVQASNRASAAGRPGRALAAPPATGRSSMAGANAGPSLQERAAPDLACYRAFKAKAARAPPTAAAPFVYLPEQQPGANGAGVREVSALNVRLDPTAFSKWHIETSEKVAQRRAGQRSHKAKAAKRPEDQAPAGTTVGTSSTAVSPAGSVHTSAALLPPGSSPGNSSRNSPSPTPVTPPNEADPSTEPRR